MLMVLRRLYFKAVKVEKYSSGEKKEESPIQDLYLHFIKHAVHKIDEDVISFLISFGH
jgi:hypothetical protein